MVIVVAGLVSIAATAAGVVVNVAAVRVAQIDPVEGGGAAAGGIVVVVVVTGASWCCCRSRNL